MVVALGGIEIAYRHRPATQALEDWRIGHCRIIRIRCRRAANDAQGVKNLEAVVRAVEDLHFGGITTLLGCLDDLHELCNRKKRPRREGHVGALRGLERYCQSIIGFAFCLAVDAFGQLAIDIAVGFVKKPGTITLLEAGRTHVRDARHAFFELDLCDLAEIRGVTFAGRAAEFVDDAPVRLGRWGISGGLAKFQVVDGPMCQKRHRRGRRRTLAALRHSCHCPETYRDGRHEQEKGT